MLKSRFIEPGESLREQLHERFNGRLRDELLAWEQFTTLLEAQVLVSIGGGTTAQSQSQLAGIPPSFRSRVVVLESNVTQM